MTAVVRCRHLATLGDDVVGLVADADPACPPPLIEGRWTFAGSSDAFEDVLAELAEGFSPGGALLRVVERRPPNGALLLADGEQVVAAAPGPGVRLRTLGGGRYAVSAGKVREPSEWTEVRAGTLLLVDPCGITTTHLTLPHREAAR